MTIVVSFPFGVIGAGAIQISNVALTALAGEASSFLQNGHVYPLRELLFRHRIPMIHQPEAVRQLALGLGLQDPNQVDPAQVDRVAKKLERYAQDPRPVSLMARAVYQQLLSRGFRSDEIQDVTLRVKALACPNQDLPITQDVPCPQDDSENVRGTVARVIFEDLLSANFNRDDIVRLAWQIGDMAGGGGGLLL